MSKLACATTLAALALGGGTALAQPDDTSSQPGTYERWDVEGSFYGGSFISNDKHQFYSESKYPNGGRPNLDRFDLESGARLALFIHPNIGIEVDASNIFAKPTKGPMASISGIAVQVLFQKPMGAWTPFLAVGDGFRHTTSGSILGADTDWPIHAGAGVRYWLTPTVGLRFDARLLLGPQEGSATEPHYTLRAAYGELDFGFAVRFN